MDSTINLFVAQQVQARYGVGTNVQTVFLEQTGLGAVPRRARRIEIIPSSDLSQSANIK